MSGALPTWRRSVYVAGVGVAIPPLSPEQEPCEKRQRKLMSHAATLGAAAVKATLASAGWTENSEVGLFMGVGASGGAMSELEAMLGASLDATGLDLGRFGTAGLGAANPLYAFQLMNNFTLCHGAILTGLEGPNAAFYSRGAGTVTALREAAFAVADGDTPRALAGGADSALHPVTASELARGGWQPAGLLAAEGAALLALADAAPEPGCPRLTHAEVLSADGRALAARAAHALDGDSPELVVIAGWGREATATLREAAVGRAGEIVDAGAVFGEALAATPALAWSLALDRLARGGPGRAVVLSAGIDGAVGVVRLAKERA